MEWCRPAALDNCVVDVSRPRRYQLWCEKRREALQGSLNQLNQLGVNLGTLEPGTIGLARHVIEVDDDSEVVRVAVEGGESGLFAGARSETPAQ